MLWSHGAGCRLGGGGGGGDVFRCEQNTLCCGHTALDVDWGGGDVFRCEQNTLCCGHTALDVDWGGRRV